MLTIYGFHMNLRQLEEIAFWKRQEKEHTSVIRTLFPTLEAPYVQQLESWKTVFEQTETAATQWMNWAVQSQQYSDANLHQQSRAIVTASRAQSQQFIRQLEEMKRSSPSIRSSLHVQSIIDHIIRESQYFIAILEPFDKHVPSSRTCANQTSIEPKQALHMDIPSSGETSWSSVVTECQSLPIGGHQLPPLPYVYDALEPYIDKKTMEIHHGQHHQSYVDGLNKAELMLKKARAKNDFELVKHWERELAFHGAGHYLHTLFWNTMDPNGGGQARGAIAEEINKSFESFDNFKKHFTQAAEKVEGCGWAILVWGPRSHRLEILQAEKHQHMSQWDIVPLLPLDVWEHAYYLTYKQDRLSYINNWWNLIHWDHVNERFLAASALKWPPF